MERFGLALEEGLLPGLPYLPRLLLTALWVVFSIPWIYLLRNISPGLPRAAASLIVLAGNFLVPLLFHPQSEFVSRFLVEFACTWLTSFKVLAWVLNRGPLSRRWSFIQFAAIMAVPITPAEVTEASKKTDNRAPADTAGRMVGRFVAKLALIMGGVWVLQYNLPEILVEYLYTMGLYAVLSLAMDGPAALITAMLGFQVSPHFSEPWKAQSLAEFWSKRWDLVAGNTLRYLFYEPILEGRLVHPTTERQPRVAQGGRTSDGRKQHTRRRGSSSARRLVGMAACFLGSAAMHELQFWYFMGHWSGGRYGGFFLAQIPMMVAERWLCGAMRQRGMQLPLALRAAITQLFILATGHYFFWAPLKQQGVMDVAVAGITDDVRLLMALVPGLQKLE